MSQKVPVKPRKKISEAVIQDIRRRAATNENRVHIIPSSGKWAVKKEGTSRASRVVDTKIEAVKIARTYLKSGAAKSIISHEKNGKFAKLK